MEPWDEATARGHPPCANAYAPAPPHTQTSTNTHARRPTSGAPTARPTSAARCRRPTPTLGPGRGPWRMVARRARVRPLVRQAPLQQWRPTAQGRPRRASTHPHTPARTHRRHRPRSGVSAGRDPGLRALARGPAGGAGAVRPHGGADGGLHGVRGRIPPLPGARACVPY
jgi:hypothetical protein